MKSIILAALVSLLLAMIFSLSYLSGVGVSQAPEPHLDSDLIPAHQQQNPWFQQGLAHIDTWAGGPAIGAAKNILLFIGDGMGISTVTAARILEGQRNGKLGEEHALTFDQFPYTALIKTYNVDAQTPDSAGTMTAIMTGVKTNIGLLGVDEQSVRNQCNLSRQHNLTSLLELAEHKNKATGIVTTTRITHATPAATYAKTVNRNWEDNSEMPNAAQTAGCKDIAHQLISTGFGFGLDLALGGGRRQFLPHPQGQRTDGQDLIAQFTSTFSNAHYLETARELAQLDDVDDVQGPILGLFNHSHLSYQHDHQGFADPQPTLTQMTAFAIKQLRTHTNGFILMIESGRIDHAHHVNHAHHALTETLEFSRAINTALTLVNLDETLVLVTADHSHAFSQAGYARRGNPILGKVTLVGADTDARDLDNRPYTVLNYINGPSARIGHEARRDLTHIDTQAPQFRQDALIPLKSETHAGEDVPLYATGAGARHIHGVLEQNVIFHLMARLAGLL